MPRVSIEGALGIATGVVLLILDKMGIGGLRVYIVLFSLAAILCVDSVIRSEWAKTNGAKQRSRQFWGGAAVCVIFVGLGFWIFRLHVLPQETKHVSESEPVPVSQAQGATKSEPPAIAAPSAPPRPKSKTLSETALALAANIRKLSQEWRAEQTKIDNASDVTDQQRKSMSSTWAAKVMAEYDSKYKVDARIIHDRLVAGLPAGSDPLVMKGDYENEENPGLLEIIASDLQRLAKLLPALASERTKKHSAAVSPSETNQPAVSQDCGGGNCAISVNQQGGITAGKYIGDPPPQFTLTTISENVPQNGLYETKFKLQVTAARTIALHLRATSTSFVGELKIMKELPPEVGGQGFMSLHSLSGPTYLEENYQFIESGSYIITLHTAHPDKVKLEYH